MRHKLCLAFLNQLLKLLTYCHGDVISVYATSHFSCKTITFEKNLDSFIILSDNSHEELFVDLPDPLHKVR